MEATATKINYIIDGILQRLDDNRVSLGMGPDDPIIEGDEFPTYISLPSIYVIPFVDGGDSITFHMGSDEASHEFPVTIVGYLKFMDITSGLRSTRDKGLTAMDLFRGAANKVDCAKLVNPRVEVRYFRVTDYIVHLWVVKYQVKTFI